MKQNQNNCIGNLGNNMTRKIKQISATLKFYFYSLSSPV